MFRTAVTHLFYFIFFTLFLLRNDSKCKRKKIGGKSHSSERVSLKCFPPGFLLSLLPLVVTAVSGSVSREISSLAVLLSHCWRRLSKFPVTPRQEVSRAASCRPRQLSGWQLLFFIFAVLENQSKNNKIKIKVKKGKNQLFLFFCPPRSRRLVPADLRPWPVAGGRPGPADAGGCRLHAGPLRQLWLGDGLPADLQRHGPQLETVPAGGPPGCEWTGWMDGEGEREREGWIDR